MRHVLFIGAFVTLSLFAGFVPALALDAQADSVAAAKWASDWFNREQARIRAELTKELAYLKSEDIQPGIALFSDSASIAKYRRDLIYVEGIHILYSTLNGDSMRVWQHLAASMIELVTDHDGYSVLGGLDASYAHFLYGEAGQPHAAQRIARKYADWLWSKYRQGGVLKGRSNYRCPRSYYDDEFGGYGRTYLVRSQFPFGTIVDWYTKAGWTASQLDSLRRLEASLPDSIRAHAD